MNGIADSSDGFEIFKRKLSSEEFTAWRGSGTVGEDVDVVVEDSIEVFLIGFFASIGE